MARDYSKTIYKLKCRWCGEIFDSRSTQRKSCDTQDCRLKELHYKSGYMNESRKKYCETEKGKIAIANLPQKRKSRRSEIRDIWGREGRNIWRKSESESLIIPILDKEGFNNITNLNTNFLCNAPFDYFAEKNGTKYVFQVTVACNTSKKRQYDMAKLFGLKHLVLFIKHDFKYYILKEEYDAELSLNDLNNLKGIP